MLGGLKSRLVNTAHGIKNILTNSQFGILPKLPMASLPLSVTQLCSCTVHTRWVGGWLGPGCSFSYIQEFWRPLWNLQNGWLIPLPRWESQQHSCVLALKQLLHPHGFCSDYDCQLWEQTAVCLSTPHLIHYMYHRWTPIKVYRHLRGDHVVHLYGPELKFVKTWDSFWLIWDNECRFFFFLLTYILKREKTNGVWILFWMAHKSI